MVLVNTVQKLIVQLNVKSSAWSEKFDSPYSSWVLTTLGFEPRISLLQVYSYVWKIPVTLLFSKFFSTPQFSRLQLPFLEYFFSVIRIFSRHFFAGDKWTTFHWDLRRLARLLGLFDNIKTKLWYANLTSVLVLYFRVSQVFQSELQTW